MNFNTIDQKKKLQKIEWYNTIFIRLTTMQNLMVFFKKTYVENWMADAMILTINILIIVRWWVCRCFIYCDAS